MASLEARLHLIRASTVGLDVGVDRKISSSYEQLDPFFSFVQFMNKQRHIEC